MDKEVTLFTKGGWRKNVGLNDPVFAQVLAPLVELGDTATELELSGTVGEAFEKEWDAIVRLEEGWKMLKRSEHEYHYSYPVGNRVFLHEVRVLSNILELPRGWELVVGVLSTDPEYKKHIKAQADVYIERGIRGAPMYVNSHQSTLYGAWGLEPMTKNPYLAALIVNRHATRERLDTVANVDWELGVELSPDLKETERMMLLSLAGKESYRSKWEWANLRGNAMVRYGVKGGLNRLNIAYNYPVAELYRYAIRLFPDDVHPDNFGLSYLVEPSSIKKAYISSPGKLGKYAVPNDLANVAVWVHMNITMIAYHNTVTTPSAFRSTFIEYASKYIIGREGLTKILLSLLHSMQVRYNMIVDAISSDIEKKLESDEQVKLLEEFPPYTN